MIELKADGLIANYYQWAYNDGLPKNFCMFFWRMIFAVSIIWFIWLSYPFGKSGIFMHIFRSFGIFAGLVVVGALITGAIESPWTALTIISAVVLVIILLGLIFFITEELESYNAGYRAERALDKVFDTVSDTYHVMKTWKTSTIDKVCPKIDWK